MAHRKTKAPPAIVCWPLALSSQTLINSTIAYLTTCIIFGSESTLSWRTTLSTIYQTSRLTLIKHLFILEVTDYLKKQRYVLRKKYRVTWKKLPLMSFLPLPVGFFFFPSEPTTNQDLQHHQFIMLTASNVSYHIPVLKLVLVWASLWESEWASYTIELAVPYCSLSLRLPPFNCDIFLQIHLFVPNFQHNPFYFSSSVQLTSPPYR